MIFALMIALGTTAVAQPKHRHHAVADTAAVVNNDAATAADKANADEAIEAFSDTTSVAVGNSTVPRVYVDDDFDFVSDDFEDMPDWLLKLLGGSIGIFAFLTIFFGILIVLVPFILAILVMRYLVRRHNDRVALASKAMETGQPLPEELMPVDKQSDDYLRRRGIRNIWIGIGMMVMFGIWDADMLTGVGALVLCYGIGQVFIARSSQKKKDNNENINP